MCTDVVVLNQFLIAVSCTWIAPILAELNGPNVPLELTTEQASWFASVNDVGKLAGPFISPALLDNIGRKHALTFATAGYFLSAVLMIFARDIYILCGARAIYGVANGVFDVVAPIYTTENCSPTFRGIISSVVYLSCSAGLLFGLLIATYIPYTASTIVIAAMAGFAFSSLYYGTETPYFLVMRGKREKAEESLRWLSGNENQVPVSYTHLTLPTIYSV